MTYRFEEPDPVRRCMKRTLLQQELLQHGILTFQGFLLPSLAHGEAELEQAFSAYRQALQRVKDVAKKGTFARHLDIPPLVA